MLTSARHAIEKYSELSPDVALIDLHMPVVDGFALARRLRHSSESSSAILVAFTGSVSSGERDAAIDAGFDHHPPKPVDIAELMRVVEKHCGRDARQGTGRRHDCGV